MTNSNAVNWLIEKATECSDGIRVFSRKTIPTSMIVQIRQHVENLTTDQKIIEPGLLNWIEDGWWFSLSFPRQKRRNSRARFENGRTEIHFECGEFSE